MRLAFDIETNGLLPDVNKLHSLCIKDIDTGEAWSCSPGGRTLPNGVKVYHPITKGLELLMQAEYVTGHNIVSYDLPVIKHLLPSFQLRPDCKVRDTFIMAKMIWPMDRLKELDFPRWRKGTLPGQMIGAHKLEAWGYRLGRMKGEYSGDVKALSKEYAVHQDLNQVPEWARCLASVDKKGAPCLDPWLAWNQPMQDYCVQDVEVTHELHKLIEGHFDGTGKAARGIGWSEESIELEHKVWKHVAKQTARGFGFDLEAGVKLAAEIKTRQVVLEDELVKQFGSWWQPQDDIKTGHKPERAYSEKMTQFPDVTIRRFGTTGKELAPYVGPPKCSYSPDAPFVRVSRVTFNPKSRQHLGERLQTVFGWVPVEWGGKNNDQAKVDETTIKAIPESVLPDALKQTLLEFLINAKTLGALSDGAKSWIGFCDDKGSIHGRVDTLGTITHRAAHFDPNLGQVSAVTITEIKDASGKVISKTIVRGWKGGFGAECRGLFRPNRRGWQQTGVDASGLQLRILGHYLFPFDGGAFSERVCTPGLDIHAANAEITGLPRGETKTVTYAVVFGSGPLLVGLAVGLDGYDVEELANSPGARNYTQWMRKVQGSKFETIKPMTLAHVVRGQAVVKTFFDGITGLKDFKQWARDTAAAQGFLVALDGRKLDVRKPHASIVQLLQGGDAIICKLWQIEIERIMREEYNLLEDVHYGQMGWIHDELQFEHEEGLHEIIKEVSERAMHHVAKVLDFKGTLTTEAKLGDNWRDCH